jgi:uncharacterized membrane protein YcaP (DUF421 family)
MFEPQAPWWEFVVRGAIVYVVLLLFVRISGTRAVGEFTPFDLFAVILLGQSVHGASIGGDQSITGGSIVAATLIALNFLVGYATTRSRAVDKLIEGEPVVLIRHGRVHHRALQRNNVTRVQPRGNVASRPCDAGRRDGAGDARDERRDHGAQAQPIRPGTEP